MIMRKPRKQMRLAMCTCQRHPETPSYTNSSLEKECDGRKEGEESKTSTIRITCLPLERLARGGLVGERTVADGGGDHLWLSANCAKQLGRISDGFEKEVTAWRARRIPLLTKETSSPKIQACLE